MGDGDNLALPVGVMAKLDGGGCLRVHSSDTSEVA